MPARKKIIESAIYFILIIAILAPRLPGLGSYVTLDEPYWLSMGANFYYALGQREFQNTVYEYQPAVTTMWIVTGALLAYFPEYRGYGQGYLNYNQGLLDDFLITHGRHPLVLLQISRALQVLVLAVLFLVLYYFLKRFVHEYVAAFTILFASFDPFFLSQSRMLDHEALLALFVMISMLALLAYLRQGRNWIFLLASGVAAGLAQLTKSSAIAMLAPIGVLFLVQIQRGRGAGWGKSIIDHAKIFLIWLGILVAAYFLFWPGMWVAPQKMLYEVYGNAFSYAFQGGRLSVTGELDAAEFSLDFNLKGIAAIVMVILRRVTPLTWLGILLGFVLLRQKESAHKMLFALLWAAAAGFIIMFGIAQGRNSPHYVLCSYLALNLLAGLGWFYTLEILARQIQFRALILSAVLALQLGSALPFYPYYYTYENPLQRRANADAPFFPYGEGLELAGQYLASEPDAKAATALVYFSRGCFSYFYPGVTTGFKNFYADGEHNFELVEALNAADYVVVYYAVQGHLQKYDSYVQALAQVEPMHEVWLNGRKYVLIYRMADISPQVIEELKNLPPQQ